MDWFNEINKKTGEIDKNEYTLTDSIDFYEIDKSYGTGLYLSEKGIIKRYAIEEKQDGKKTGVFLLIDKKISPVVIYPSKSIFVNNKNELELTDGKVKRMLTDEALISMREFKKYLQQFHRDYWFDGDNEDVVKYHKLIILMKKTLEIKTEKVNNQFGWINDKFSPYDIPVFIDDPVLKELEESFDVKGDREEWLNLVKEYRTNTIFETQFLTALAAPLVKIFKCMPMWVHVSGKSSTCKTAAMIVVASIYGNPTDDGRNLITSFNTTIVGLENRSHILNNLPVFLNDSQNLSNFIRPDDLVYLGFEGKGRNRGSKNEQSRQVKRWATTYISNGEKSLLNKNCFEGAAKRCIQLDGSSMELGKGKKVRRIFYQNYGHIGREWIDIIKKLNIDESYKIIDYIYNKLQDLDNIDDNIQQVTTMCLCRYLFEININKTEKKKAIIEAIEVGKKILGLVDISKTSADMCNKIIAYLKEFVQQNLSRFEDDKNLQQERFGFMKDGNICFFNNKLDEILIKDFNYDPKLFRKEIKERNLVVLDKTGQIKQIKYLKANGRYPQFLQSVMFGLDEKIIKFEDKIIENEGLQCN